MFFAVHASINTKFDPARIETDVIEETAHDGLAVQPRPPINRPPFITGPAFSSGSSEKVRPKRSSLMA